MCNECCKVFKGWCKSFTLLETFLSILEGVLLLLLLCLLIFVITHFLTCSKHMTSNTDTNSFEKVTRKPNTQEEIGTHYLLQNTTVSKYFDTTIAPISRGILSPDKQCSWTPSAPTKATTVFYEKKSLQEADGVSKSSIFASDADYALSAEYEDDEILNFQKNFVLALVKPGPAQTVAFGCILTIVSEYWTVSAASCVESVERAGGLGGWEMAAASGERHVVVAVRRSGRDSDSGVAALRSYSALVASAATARLPTALDRMLTTLGERLAVLDYTKVWYDGFWYKFPVWRMCRSPRRELRRTLVSVVALERCDAQAEPSALTDPDSDALEPYCVRPLGGEDEPDGCRYSWGRPLVRGRTLLAVQRGVCAAGVARLYAGLPAAAWLARLLRNDSYS